MGTGHPSRRSVRTIPQTPPHHFWHLTQTSERHTQGIRNFFTLFPATESPSTPAPHSHERSSPERVTKAHSMNSHASPTEATTSMLSQCIRQPVDTSACASQITEVTACGGVHRLCLAYTNHRANSSSLTRGSSHRRFLYVNVIAELTKSAFISQ